MSKTYGEIKEKIQNRQAVVMTAEEVIEFVRNNGTKTAADEIDVVTTATFGTMCSSGAFLNVGHTKPKIKFGGGSVTLNDVECYAGLAAVDLYVGATARIQNGTRNDFSYGGGHVIHDLVAGKDVRLQAKAKPSTCYPREEIDKWINIKEIGHAALVNPRNAYQNYNVAVNKSEKTIYTYMGKLLPEISNANYSSAGQLSPLLNDPYYETIGIGTRVWVAGSKGYVFSSGTQHSPHAERGKNGVPVEGAGTLGISADMKCMDPDFISGTSFTQYGNSLAVGLGVPIPMLNENIAKNVSVKDSEIFAPVVDYSHDYPNATGKTLGKISYADLRSGEIEVCGKKIPTGSLSSYSKAVVIAEKLKSEIDKGKFLVQEPVELLPSVPRGGG